MSEVEAFEARNTLSALIAQAESGEEVVITRHGREVGRLVPPKGMVNRDVAHHAAQRIREMSKGVTPGGLCIRDMINEGRR